MSSWIWLSISISTSTLVNFYEKHRGENDEERSKIYVTVIILLTFIRSCFLLTGCIAEASASNNSFTTLYSSPMEDVSYYMDP